MKPFTGWYLERARRMDGMIEEGKTVQQVAEHFQVSATTVRYNLNRLWEGSMEIQTEDERARELSPEERKHFGYSDPPALFCLGDRVNHLLSPAKRGGVIQSHRQQEGIHIYLVRWPMCQGWFVEQELRKAA